MLFKIAYAGMKGRKKDSLAMIIIVVLALIFVTTSINLFSSVQAAKAQERFEKFGQWRSAYFNVLEGESILTSEELPKPEMFFLGLDKNAGQVASLPEAYETLGTFKMFEGKMPTEPNEIAIENSQRSNFPRNMAIGDTIVVEQIFYISDFKVAGHSSPSIEAYEREEMGKKDALEKQFDRLATYEYPHYLASIAEFEKKETPLSYDAFLSYYKANAKDIKAYFREVEIAEITGEQLMMPMYLLENNLYNTIESEFHDAYQVDRIQSLIYYKQNLKGESSMRAQRNIKVGDVEDETLSLVELIQKYGYPYTDYVKVTKEYVLSGIFEDYSNIWASGDYYYPTAFVLESEKNNILDVLSNTGVIEGSDTLKRENTLFGKRIVFFDQPQLSTEDVRYVENHLAYPEEKSNANLILTYGVLALIFIGTVVSVFQINYAQIRRRTKKLVLLKSIGMVKRQVMALLLFEVMIILIVALPLGLLLGMGSSYGIILSIKHVTGVSLTLQWHVLWLVYGVFIVVLSVFIGMIIPLRQAKRVPLVGAMNVVPNRSNQTKRSAKAETLKVTRMTPMRLIWGRLKEDRKKSWMTFLIYTFASTLLLITVPLSLIAFKPYQEKVVVPNLPDYEMTFSIGLDPVSKDQITEELAALDLFETVDMVLRGEQLRVYNPHWKAVERYQNQINTADAMGKLSFLTDVFDPMQSVVYTRETLLSNVYTYNFDSKTLQALLERSGTTMNGETFSKSKNQALLLLPYHDGKTSISYRQQEAWRLDQPYPFKVGDMLKVASINESNEKPSYLKLDLEIAAIVVGFDAMGIWPFTDQSDEPILILPEAAYRTLYPQTRYKFLPPSDMVNNYVENEQWMKFGKTHLALTLTEGKTVSDADVAFKSLSKAQITNLNELELTRYDYAKINPTHFIKESVFNKSLRMAFIVSILGLSMSLILWLVQYNIGISKAESERTYIGVLQAIGITNRAFRNVYMLIGCGYAIAALLVTNALIFGGILLLSIISPLPVGVFFNQFFWGFPWSIYALLQVIFFAVGLWVYVSPYLKVIQNKPVANITALQR